ncbi:MAG TPA: glycerol kinase, partial [Nannocystis sp.]
EMVETTALGAAGLAGLAAGIWPDAEAFRAAFPAPTLFRPVMDGAAREALLLGWRRAIAACRAWSTHASR